MKNFAAYTVGLDLVRALRPIVEELKKYDPDLADQVRRAANSVILNVGEGARRAGRDPRRFFTIAHGSANEIQSGLDLAEAWGVALHAEHARQLLDRELGLLWGLTRR
ncbi:MAG TPA: four helix bundle protein [Kofleriaceae bacterium]|nr:four helix bundle protein [Kofleriaceae bacterium]